MLHETNAPLDLRPMLSSAQSQSLARSVDARLGPTDRLAPTSAAMSCTTGLLQVGHLHKVEQSKRARK
jgi:hypothetical protein